MKLSYIDKDGTKQSTWKGLVVYSIIWLGFMSFIVGLILYCSRIN